MGPASSSGAISGAMNPHNHDKKGIILNYQVSRTQKKKKKDFEKREREAVDMEEECMLFHSHFRPTGIAMLERIQGVC